jgi:hypothetical protein
MSKIAHVPSDKIGVARYAGNFYNDPTGDGDRDGDLRNGGTAHCAP